MTPQVTRVVVCHFLLIFLGDFKFAVADELEKELRDMDDFEVHFKFAILIFKGMVAMRGSHQDFLYAAIDKSLDIFFC